MAQFIRALFSSPPRQHDISSFVAETPAYVAIIRAINVNEVYTKLFGTLAYTEGDQAISGQVCTSPAKCLPAEGASPHSFTRHQDRTARLVHIRN